MPDIYTKNRSYHSRSNLCFNVIFNCFAYSLSLPGQRQQWSSTLHECIKEKPPAASLTNKVQESSYFICFLFYFKLQGWFVAHPVSSLSIITTSTKSQQFCYKWYIGQWLLWDQWLEEISLSFSTVCFFFFLFFHLRTFDWSLKILLLSIGVQQPDSDAILVLSDLWQQNFLPQEAGVRDLVQIYDWWAWKITFF